MRSKAVARGEQYNLETVLPGPSLRPVAPVKPFTTPTISEISIEANVLEAGSYFTPRLLGGLESVANIRSNSSLVTPKFASCGR